MTAVDHALIAIACMIGTYLWGKYTARKEVTATVEDIIEQTLESLEKEGFIETKMLNGEKELIPISEIKEALDK